MAANHSAADRKYSLFWASSLDCYYGDIQASYTISSVITERFEKNLDKYILTFPHLHYGSLPTTNFKAFFHATRLENIYFDVATKTGNLFLLGQQLQRGMVGLVCIDSSEEAVFLQALKALGFLKRQTADKKPAMVSMEEVSDLNTISEIFGRVKVEVKRGSGESHVQTEVAKSSRFR